jgi:hypothetical protein
MRSRSLTRSTPRARRTASRRVAASIGGRSVQDQPEFAHDEVRRYAVARLLLTAGDRASKLTQVGVPRWALAATRLRSRLGALRCLAGTARPWLRRSATACPPGRSATSRRERPCQDHRRRAHHHAAAGRRNAVVVRGLRPRPLARLAARTCRCGHSCRPSVADPSSRASRRGVCGGSSSRRASARPRLLHRRPSTHS